MSRKNCFCWIILMAAIVAAPLSAQAQTPMRWLAHDMQRPKPKIVTPPRLAAPVTPPSDAIVLFGGGDLSNWRDAEGGPAKWIVRDGVMESVPNSGYVYTAESFGDGQLHVEWAAPTPARGSSQGRGNSGVFLMGLYEVQVLDSYENETYADGQAAAIYGQYPPLVNACLPPGEWQTYDITFRRPRFREDGTLASPARMTVLHNGVLVQDNVELWGPTAWLQNMPYTSHAEKLPLGLQDHGNPVRFRNIWWRDLPDPAAADPPPPIERMVVDLSADALQKFVGDYGSLLGDFGAIELDGNQLRLHMETGQVIDLLPLDETRFALRWTAGEITFKLKDDGAVSGFVMEMGGQKYPIVRRPASE